MNILLKNNSGQVKEVNTGFSWKVLFFGPLVPLFQGEIVLFIVTTILCLLIVGCFFIPFIYNKNRIQRLIKKGFYPIDEYAKNILASKNIHAEPALTRLG